MNQSLKECLLGPDLLRPKIFKDVVAGKEFAFIEQPDPLGDSTNGWIHECKSPLEVCPGTTSVPLARQLCDLTWRRNLHFHQFRMVLTHD